MRMVLQAMLLSFSSFPFHHFYWCNHTLRERSVVAQSGIKRRWICKLLGRVPLGRTDRSLFESRCVRCCRSLLILSKQLFCFVARRLQSFELFGGAVATLLFQTVFVLVQSPVFRPSCVFVFVFILKRWLLYSTKMLMNQVFRYF